MKMRVTYDDGTEIDADVDDFDVAVMALIRGEDHYDSRTGALIPADGVIAILRTGPLPIGCDSVRSRRRSWFR